MHADRHRFEVGNLIQDTVALVRRNQWRALIAFIVMAGTGITVDLSGTDAGASNLLFNILAIFFQFWLTSALLSEFGLRQAGSGGFGAAFAVSLLSQLGIIIGLILLVIPGVIGLVRWSIVVPVALSGRTSVMESLRRSTQMTEGHFWSILAVLALAYLPITIAAGAAFLLNNQQSPIADVLILNVGVTFVLVVGWHAAVAIFLAAEPNQEWLEEVFA